MGPTPASAKPAVLIAQMTDVHIGFAPDEKPEELNLTRFRATLARLIDGPNRPDMLVLSGDITDHGDTESFATTVNLLRDCPFPVLPMVGNHDCRRGLLSAFPQVEPAEGGFLHYVATVGRFAKRARIGCRRGWLRLPTRRR
jgi:DNA repair exonuclease SbcCD nuclease subunit